MHLTRGRTWRAMLESEYRMYGYKLKRIATGYDFRMRQTFSLVHCSVTIIFNSHDAGRLVIVGFPHSSPH